MFYCSTSYSLSCHGGSVVVFHKFYRIAVFKSARNLSPWQWWFMCTDSSTGSKYLCVCVCVGLHERLAWTVFVEAHSVLRGVLSKCSARWCGQSACVADRWVAKRQLQHRQRHHRVQLTTLAAHDWPARYHTVTDMFNGRLHGCHSDVKQHLNPDCPVMFIHVHNGSKSFILFAAIMMYYSQYISYTCFRHLLTAH